MIGRTVHAPHCAICNERIARVEPTRRDSEWTHGADNGRTPRVTAKDRRANVDHAPRP